MFRNAAARLAQGSRALAQPSRSFAAAAAESVVLPPQYAVPGRYAAALYQAAAKAGELPAVSADLVQVGEILSESREFAEFVADPTVPRKVKVDGLSGILSGLKASELTKNFFVLLADNQRLGFLPAILSKYETLAAQASGAVSATITTAEPWAEADLAEIKTRLSSIVGGSGELNLVQKIDPSILGGVVIDLDDKHVDLSVASRVRKLQKLIREASL